MYGISKLTVTTVAQMAKDKKWGDVHLLSFDLQTVEFAYAAVSYPFGDIRATYGTHRIILYL